MNKVVNATVMPEILLIEDDLDLSQFIMDYLNMESMHCDNAMTGSSGLELAQSDDLAAYDCIVLDLNLPVIDGLTVCKTLRQNGVATPIIMLTARDRLDDKLAGFAHGADDYLCKPFDIQELVARIISLTQRNARNSLLACEELQMDLTAKTARRGARQLSLSGTEWKIMRLLLSHTPHPVNRQKIICKIWGDSPPETDSLKVHMHNLRKIINGANERPLLHTIQGYGYAICVK